MLNDTSSLLTHLRSRRSARPRDLVAPGPDAAQLREIVTMATRTPDHGKLRPWRLVTIGASQRDAFAAMLREAYLAEKPDAGQLELDSMDLFAHQAPALVAVLSTPVIESKIPVWEQQLSAGAVTMNLLHAAHAFGFVGGWVTGWPAYNRDVTAALGAGPDDRIAGFVFIGTPLPELEERARPDVDSVLTHWKPDSLA